MSYDSRPAAGEFAGFYQKYVDLVPDGDIIAILATQLDDTSALLRELTDQQSLYAYAPGKWSVKQVVGHLTDSERIFACRALRFARGDQTPLPGFDEVPYAAAGEFDQRPLASLLAELSGGRRSTLALLAGLPADAWTRGGSANGQHVTVRALAWITAGHELHHREILASRYLEGLFARQAFG
ncbi:MAG: DinB family protein [Gemmatimonadota bacterium]